MNVFYVFLLTLCYLSKLPTLTSAQDDYSEPAPANYDPPPQYAEQAAQPDNGGGADYGSQPAQPDYSNQPLEPEDSGQSSANVDSSPEAMQSAAQPSVGSESKFQIERKEVPEEKPQPVNDVNSGLQAWMEFKNKFMPQMLYKDEPSTESTEIKRITTWKDSRDKVQVHNAKVEQGLLPFTLKLNPLSALHPKEVSAKLCGAFAPIDPVPRASHNHTRRRRKRSAAPESLDYREHDGYVSALRDQRQCGCCWAMSAAECIEGQLFGYYGRAVKLSAQQLIDCSKGQGNNGCNGGWPMNAFDYVKENGIMLESKYPFSEQDTQQCFAKGRVPSVQITGGEYLIAGDENEIKEALWDVGPLSVCLNADGFNFQHYSQGVYKDDSCSKNVNHAVLLVGYGTDKATNLPYWLLKNSWGKDWGDGGYIKIYRGDNQCGVASWAQYPLFS